MSLLRDQDLVASLQNSPPIITDLEPPSGGNWYTKASSIQASSVDLHVGNIYLPKRTLMERVFGPLQPDDHYSLRPGQTAVVTTLESLNLPNDMAGIGFPPSGVSFQGLLMTNPGHIDPGYVGPMRFTVINMGRQDFSLRRGDKIVTVLLFRLAAAVHTDWLARNHNAPGGQPQPTDLARLSHDFLDVERRAKRIANRRLQFAGAISAAIAIFVAMAQPFAVGWFPNPNWADQLRARVDTLAALVDLKSQQSAITQIQGELRDVKEATCRQSPRPTYCKR